MNALWFLGMWVACRSQPPVAHTVPGPIHDAAVVMSPNVTGITVDATGAVWAMPDRLGLTRFDPSTGHVRLFTQRDGLPLPRVRSVAAAPNGDVWLATRNGIVRQRHGTTTLEAPLRDMPGVRKTVVGNGPGGAVAVAVSGRGLARVEGDEVSWVADAQSLPGPLGWRALWLEPDGSFWLATRTAGLWRYDATTRIGSWAEDLPSIYVTSLVQGPDGIRGSPLRARDCGRSSSGNNSLAGFPITRSCQMICGTWRSGRMAACGSQVSGMA